MFRFNNKERHQKNVIDVVLVPIFLTLTHFTQFLCVFLAVFEHIFVCFVFIACNKKLFDTITKGISVVCIQAS